MQRTSAHLAAAFISALLLDRAAFGEAVTHLAPSDASLLPADYTAEVDGEPAPGYHSITHWQNEKYSMAMSLSVATVLLALIFGAVCPAQEIKLAKPTATQLALQDLELGVFIHYSIDTYAERSAPHGSTPASAFNPTELNAEQWVLAAKSMGATFVVLTARHEEGFCLWPTKTTDYSVKSSPYKNGKGDIVREFIEACRKHSLKVGLYNPPWIDSHWELSQPDLSPGRDTGRIDKLDNPLAYERALAKEKDQLRELMTNYGPLVFVWDDHYGRSDSLDAVPHGGPFRKFYATMAKLAHELQPDCLYFGPDVEHVGNEDGHSCYPMWNAVTTIDGTDDTISTTYKWNRENTGDQLGKFYRPRLGSTTNGFSTGGWMWTGPRRPQPLERRMQVYYETIGRGAGILVNLTPDRRGLIPEDLVTAAKEMGDEIKRRFSHPIAQSTAKDAVQTLKFAGPQTFDHVVTKEDLRDGQKIARYTIEAQVNGEWKTIVEGQTIGHKRIDQFAPVTATAVRFTCTESIAQPVVMRSVAVFNASANAVAN
jgi:alpha-L-fucosidase